MNRSVDTFRNALLATLLHKARAGSPEALGRLLEACRAYLLRIARQELAASLRAKVDEADVVQETFIEAVRGFPTFRGETSQELLCWLRGILLHNIADLVKHFGSRRRCLSQEVSLPDHPRISDPRTQDLRSRMIPVHDQVIAQEQRRALNDAVQRLPQLYRLALQLHFSERRSFAEIGDGLQRSAEAARKMVGRALERLRRQMRVHAGA